MAVTVGDPESTYRRLCLERQTPPNPSVIASFDRLPELDLSQQTLPTETCQVLGEFLQTSSFVTKLNVADCLLERAALKHLLQGVRGSLTLHSINLKGNDIHGESVKHLAAAISRSNSIQRLTLEWNNVGQTADTWSELCGSVARSASLTHLDLRSNQLSEAHSDGLATIIRQSSTLVSLDLRWNKLGNTGGRRLLQALQFNTKICRLSLEGNCINHDILDLIGAILSGNIGQRSATQPAALPETRPNLNHLRLEPSIRTSSPQVDQLRVRLEHMVKLLDATRRELDGKVNAHQRFVDESEVLKAEIGGYQTRVRTLEDRLETLESSLAGARRSAQQQKEGDAKIIQDLRQKLAQCERSLQEAEDSHERNELQRGLQLSELQGRASSLQEQHAALSAQLRAARLETERIIADERLRGEQQEKQLKQSHQQDIERLENVHAGRIAEKKRALAALQEAKNAMEAALVHQDAKLEADRVRAEADLSALKQKLSLEQTRIAQQLEVQREAHERAQASSEEALAKQVAENTNLSQHILGLKRRINELTNDKLQLSGEVDRLNNEVQTREEAVRAQYRRVQDENTSLRRDLQQLEDDLREKKRQLNEARSRHDRERTEWTEKEQRHSVEHQENRRRKRELLSVVQDFVGDSHE